MSPGELDLNDVMGLIDEAAACAALLAATLTKLSASLRSTGAVDAIEDAEHQHAQRVKAIS